MSAPVTAVDAELALETSETKFLPTPTAILDAMIMAVAAVDLLNGFGPPDTGDAFGSGRDKLYVARLHLEAAAPDSRDWDGAAAQAYATANAHLQTLVSQLEDLDKRMQALMAEHGAAVKEAHTVCLVTGLGLKAAAFLAASLYAIPVYGAEASLAFQIVTALGAAGVVLAFESMLISASLDRMSAANALAAGYVAVGRQAEPSGEFAKIDVREVAQTRVSSFSVGTERVPMPSGMSGVPTIAALAGDRARLSS